MLRYPVLNSSRPHLSAAPMSPVFNATFRHMGKSVTVPTIFDTGMRVHYASITPDMANQLGVVETGKGEAEGASGGVKEVGMGVIDFIKLGDLPCSLSNVAVMITEGAPHLGQPFLAATGLAIRYQDGKANLSCTEESGPVGIFPTFNFDLESGGRRETVKAILDTGLDGGMVVSDAIARRLGLEKTSQINLTTFDGSKIRVWDSKIGRISFAGHPKCGADSVRTYIMPEDSQDPHIVVGDDFMRAIPGESIIGYDSGGAWLYCSSEDVTFRALSTEKAKVVPPEMLSDGAAPTVFAPEGGSSWVPWLLGAAAIGLVTWLFPNKK